MDFLPDHLSSIPEYTGVYQFFNSDNRIIYIGKAINLKKRISSYFRKSALRSDKQKQLYRQIKYIKIIPLDYEFQALIYEANLIRKYKPKYNVIWKDDKHYIYIEITKDIFPKIGLARKQTVSNSHLFGPFISARVAKGILSDLRKIFPFCTQKRNGKRRCFYTHLGLCNPCPSEIITKSGEEYKKLRKEYLTNIRKIKSLMNGNIKYIEIYLRKKMKNLSKANNFEEAALCRDRIMHLKYLAQNSRITADLSSSDFDNLDIHIKEKNELRKILIPFYPEIKNIDKIECYDISTISGMYTAGSLVSFQNGLPDKNNYRKFKIKFVRKMNDFAALAEIISRRLNHSDWKMPDLFVLDGGKPQLIAVKKIFDERNIHIPCIGLAKEDEEIVAPVGIKYTKIKLPGNSHALQLLQRIRDEAHRFAHRYHTQLRNKNVFP